MLIVWDGSSISFAFFKRESLFLLAWHFILCAIQYYLLFLVRLSWIIFWNNSLKDWKYSKGKWLLLGLPWSVSDLKIKIQQPVKTWVQTCFSARRWSSTFSSTIFSHRYSHLSLTMHSIDNSLGLNTSQQKQFYFHEMNTKGHSLSPHSPYTWFFCLYIASHIPNYPACV